MPEVSGRLLVTAMTRHADIIYVSRPGGGLLDAEAIPLAPGTVELELPPNVQLCGGAIPDHVHHVSNPDAQIAVWVDRSRCRWCRARR